jgi:hypothetical protein
MKKIPFLVNLVCFFCLLSLTLNGQDKDADQITHPRFKYALSVSTIVDYDSPESNNSVEREIRKLKNKRYDNEGWVYKNITNPNIGGVGRVDEIPPPPAIPAAESSFIIIGEIINVSSFMSNDKTGIYTEYTIRVEAVIKADASNKLKAGDSVIADRDGGCVRYANGRIVMYGNSNKGLPHLKTRYLLFLHNPDKSPNYRILTGYAFREDKVMPLDDIAFDKFQGISEQNFLKKVRETILNPSTK